MKYHKKFWNNYFKYYDVLMELIPYRDLMKELIDNLNIKPEHRILDFGSGTGNLLYFIPKTSKVIGVDNSTEAILRMKNKFPNSKVILHSILKQTPFKDESFDRIVSNNVLYTLRKENRLQVIAELARISKPGAIVVVSNLRKGFKPLKIYRDHVVKSIAQNGIISSVGNLFLLSYKTIQMIRFNRVISKKNGQRQFSFFSNMEQVQLFEQHGFKLISPEKSVYAGQALLCSFRKVS